MKIRNAVIITDASTELSMRIDELPDSSGNVVFSRLNLPPGDPMNILRYKGYQGSVQFEDGRFWSFKYYTSTILSLQKPTAHRHGG
jgi:hypothetical protein